MLQPMVPDLIIKKHGLTISEVIDGRKVWIVECRMEIVVRSGLRSRALERHWGISHASSNHLRKRWDSRKTLKRYKDWILFRDFLADFATEVGSYSRDLVGKIDRRFPERVNIRGQLIRLADDWGFLQSEIAKGLSISEDTVKYYRCIRGQL